MLSTTIRAEDAPSKWCSVARACKPNLAIRVDFAPSGTLAVQTKDTFAEATKPIGAQRRTGSEGRFHGQVHGGHFIAGQETKDVDPEAEKARGVEVTPHVFVSRVFPDAAQLEKRVHPLGVSAESDCTETS